MNNDAVIVQEVIKDFPAGETSIRVLHNVNLTVAKGKLTMLVGPSGCGKTTLISIMTGILSPTSGDVTIDGTTITRLSDKEKVLFRRQYLGFIFQQYNLLPSLTAAENAAIALMAADVPHEDAVAASSKVLSQIGMAAHINKLPSQLSGGQQQRIAIARALVHQPKFIVCDEPTAALDAHSGHTVMEILRDIANDTNRAVVVVTHDNRIFHFADRIVHMSDGRVEKEEDIVGGNVPGDTLAH